MSPPVRVLYVDNTFTFGGAIESLALLVSAWKPDDVAPYVVTGQPLETAHTMFSDVPVESWNLRLPWISPDPIVGDPTRPRSRALPRWLRVVRSAWWAVTNTAPMGVRIAKTGRRHRADLIHLNNLAEVQPDAILAAKLLGIPCVAHSRAHPDSSLRSARLLTSLPDHHIAISRSVRDAILATGVAEDRVTVVPNAVDLVRFQPGAADERLQRELEIPLGSSIVGHIGRIVPWKGQLEFLEAFARVASRDARAHALLLGDRSDGAEAYEQGVRRRAEEEDLRGRVTLLGFRRDVAEVMRLCRVIVHSSTSPEPFGRVIIEAMALGIPVVAANSGGPMEIIRHGESGYLVDPRDAEALAGTVQTLLSDSGLHARVSSRAIERVHAHYSPRAHATQIADVYRRVLRA